MESIQCPKCGKKFVIGRNVDESRKNRPEKVALDEYGMCKGCILNSGEYNQKKSASIIRQINIKGR